MAVSFNLIDGPRPLTHLRLAGALDLEWTQTTGRALRDLLIGHNRPAVIDLSEVRLLSPAAVSTLVTCCRRLLKAGHDMVVVRPPGLIAGVLSLWGLTGVFKVADSFEDALGKLWPGAVDADG